MKYIILIIIAFLLSKNIKGQIFEQSILSQQVFLSQGILECPSNSWKLIFYDEFEGSSLDESKWVTYYPYASEGMCEFCRTHGDEGQIYRDDNVVVSGGTLRLVAKRENGTWFGQNRQYTSGMIHSVSPFNFYYGKFEIRAKIPNGKGFWPAFWLYGADANEIDIFEFGCDKPNWLYTNVHAEIESSDEHWDWSEKYIGTNYSNSFHVYTMEWEVNQIIFKVDGNIIRRMPRYWTILGQPLYCNSYISSAVYIENLLMPDNQLSVILNLAIGNENTPFTGSPDLNTILPNQFEIDYIRVYQRQPQSGFYDLCSNRNITGESTICGGQHTYYFNGSSSDLTWYTSSNLSIVNSTANSITIQPLSTSINENAYVRAIDNLPCGQNVFTKNVWIGKPYNPDINIHHSVVGLNSIVEVSAFSFGASNYHWSIGGGAIIDGQGTDEILLRTSSTCLNDLTIRLNTSNTCGSSTQVQKTIPYDCSGGPSPLSLSPNPTNNILNVSFNEGIVTENAVNVNETKNEELLVTITNQYLMTVYKQKHKSKQFSINMSSLPSGIYYLQIIKGKMMYSEKVIISR